MDGPATLPDVPIEVYQIILENVSGFRVMSALVCVCRAALAAAGRLPALRIGGRRLTPLQAHIRDQVLAMPGRAGPLRPPQLFELQAYMGFGKTLTAYAAVLSDAPGNKDHRYVIAVPPKAYDTWVKEYCATFGVAARHLCEDTRVIFADSSVPAHAARARAAAGAHKAASDEQRALADVQEALGPSVRVLVVSAVSGTVWEFARVWATRLVLDEAATEGIRAGRKLRPLRAIVGWQLCLSADPLGVDVWGRVCVSPAQAEGLVPEVALRWEHIAPAAPTALNGMFDESRQFVGSGQKVYMIRDNFEEYRGVIARVFAGIPEGQVVAYVPDGLAGDLLTGELTELLAPAGWTITRFIKSTTRIRGFEGQARAVLVIGLDKSEAINIAGSHLLLFRPDWVNIDRYRQIIGRLIRQQNRRPTVFVAVVAPRGLPAQRLMHYEAVRWLAARGVEFPAAPPPTPEGYARADLVFRALGSALAAAAPVEVVAVMGAVDPWAAGAARALHAEWAAGPGQTLADAQMRCLLGLPNAVAGAGAAGDDWIDSLLDSL